MTQEKRQHPRIELSSTVLIAPAQGGYLSSVMDVSVGGCRVSRPLEWLGEQPGPFRLFFIFDHETVVELSAYLIWAAELDLGFAFSPDQSEDAQRLMYESRFASSLS